MLNQRLEVDHIPKKVISMLTELTEKERKQNEFIDLTRIDDSLRRILFPFQEQSVRYLVITFLFPVSLHDLLFRKSRVSMTEIRKYLIYFTKQIFRIN